MKKTFYISIFLVIFAGNIIFTLPNGLGGLIRRFDALSSNPNPLIRHFSPTWRSIKKIIDVPYLLLGTVGWGDSLPRYEIELTKNDLSNLLQNLPRYPEENRLYESYKQGVKGTFRFGDYETTDAKIRYRGVSPNHWNALKKSIQVNLPEEEPLGERTVLRFFIGEDKGWVKGLLWNHLAEKLNLMSPKMEAAELVINKKPMGVYMLVEGWEESFLERNGRQLAPLFANKNIPIKNVDLFLPESAFQWYDRFEDSRSGETFPQLMYFLSLIANAPDAVFKKEIESILDMDVFLRWTLATMLSGNFHQGNEANQNFYFNSQTGLFEPIFFDAALSDIGDAVDLSGNRLVNRALKNSEIRNRFEELLASYVNDSAHLHDDLALYDEMTAKLFPAITRDTKKIQTTWEIKQQMARERASYEKNFHVLQSMLKEGGLRLQFAEESYPRSPYLLYDTFETFRAKSASRTEFLARYHQFAAGVHPSTIILLPGAHIFSHTVIVPKNIRLIIREGAELYFAPDVSLISYSPVHAIGGAARPVVLKRLIDNKPWGVFALINTNEKNVFTHTRIYGGKDATINGIYFSGMLSAHNADLEFRHGIIENASADDGIHILSGEAIITDSLFRGNSADGVDIDFAKDQSLFERNLFTATGGPARPSVETGGDAMDLSFSKITVRENTIHTCGDKGVSVGEASTPRIEHNTIKGCAYGIAVKDRSEAIIANNTLENNKTAIGLYRKKPHFISGGTALLIENTFIDNKQDTLVDEYSIIK